MARVYETSVIQEQEREILETLNEHEALKSDQAHGWCQNRGTRNSPLHPGRREDESLI